MGTPTIPERLATLEADMRTVKSDVAEVKRDVKTLLASNASSLGIVAFLGRIAPWVALCVAGYAAVTR